MFFTIILIYFITGNTGKFKYASKELEKYGITIQQKELDILEIQSPDIEEVTKNKAQQAFEQIKKPLLITDSGWNISALNGFPGPYMHDVNNWLSNKDFLKLMEGKKDKTIYLEYITVYMDENIEKVFKSSFKGYLIKEEKGQGGNEFDRIVTFRKDGQTSAQCHDKGINFHDFPEHPLWKQVGEWLKINA